MTKDEARTAIKEALAQPEQETAPVAKNEGGRITWLIDDWPQNCFLYSEPPSWTPVEIGVDVTSEGAHVVGMYVLPDAVRYVFYSQFHTAPQPEQEPVAHWSDCAVHSEPAYPKGECDCGGFNPTAWLVEDADGSHLYWAYKEPIGNEKWTPLFSTPPQRTWVGLTDDEYFGLQMKIKTPMISVQDYIDAMRMVEAKLKDKNGYAEEKNT